jgi:hypothetical protein
MVTVKRRLVSLALAAGVAALATPSLAQASRDHLSARERAATRECNLKVEKGFHEYSEEANRYYSYLACMDEHGFNVSD